jgi:hypothetical protein
MARTIYEYLSELRTFSLWMNKVIFSFVSDFLSTN